MVSVFCYTYNHEKYIAEAIEGFLMQKTQFPFEIIIHDDASSDRTQEIVLKYKEKYGDIIKCILRKENSYSKVHSFKEIDEAMLRIANGKYIAICEGDDYWTDELKLEKQVAYMECHPDCTLCFHNATVVDEKKNIISYIFPPYVGLWRYQYFKGYGRYDSPEMLLWDYAAGASIVFRREDFLQRPEFYYDYLYEDIVLRQYLTYKGYAYFMRDTMSAYRTGHEGSITTWKNSDIKNKVKALRDCIGIYHQLNRYMNYKYDKQISTIIKNFQEEIVDSYEFEGWVWWTKFNKVIEYSKSYEKIYLYGAGLYGRFCEAQLASNGIKIAGYLVSEGQTRPEECNGHRVYYPHEIEEELQNSGIIVCVENSFPICQLLDRRNFSHYMVMQIKKKERLLTEECKGIYKGGLLRLRLTNRCPAKCRFCGLKKWPLEEQLREMDPKWYYEYLKPMYPRFKTVLLSGGDCFVAKETYNYIKFLSKEYPHITIWTESNGVPFVRKFQEIACDNLIRTHFSVNASNPETFVRGCWDGANGEKVYETIITNIKDYVQLLKKNGKECYAPSISMVINKDTYDDVEAFVRLALELEASSVFFFFDYTEHDMDSDCFSNEEGRIALKELMGIDRVLKGKFFIYYKLWVPMKEVEEMQSVIDALPLEQLQEKYRGLAALAEKRSISKEFEQRNELRAKYGKALFSLAEDYDQTLQTIEFGKCTVCKAPWNEIDLYPNGKLDFCGWHSTGLNLYDFIENDGGVDWEKIINSLEYQKRRYNILHGSYAGCMKCCPYNGEQREIKSIFE